MAKYEKDDCRDSAGLGKTVSDYPRFYELIPGKVMIASRGQTRHEKRSAKHTDGRKNTRGFIHGFNATTWADYCQERALANAHKA